MDPITAMAQQAKYGLGQPITALRIIRQYRRALERASDLSGRERVRFVYRAECEIYRQLLPVLGVGRTLKQADRVRRLLDRLARRQRAQAEMFVDGAA